MKRWPTTPVVKTKMTAKKITILMIAVVFAVATPLQMARIVRADSYDDQIAQIQSEIDQYQSQASKLGGQADSLQREVASLTAQANVIQGQINLSQTKHDQLTQQIAANQKKISDDKTALGDTIADIYVDSNISPLEMLASSRSISDFVDKQTYRNSIRDNLVSTIVDINNTKKELLQQQADVDRVIAEQQQAKDALVAKQEQQNQLIAQTRGQEAAYQTLVSNQENQKLQVQQQQQNAIEAAIRAANNGSIPNILPGDPNKGGYPWETGCWLDANAVSHGGIYGDGTDALGYGCRQCVSYAAWRAGHYSGNFPRYWGNANQWPSSAVAAGYKVGSTPRINSVGIISAGEYGHAVWVEAVNGDGTVDVSQYNYYNAGGSGWGNYSRMRLSSSTYDTYIYF